MKHYRYKNNFTEVKEMTLKLVIFFITIAGSFLKWISQYIWQVVDTDFADSMQKY